MRKLNQMKKIIPFTMLLLIVSLLSCNSSKTDTLITEVKNDIISSLREEGDYDTQIESLTLSEKSTGNYVGILTTREGGDLFSYEITVNLYGDLFEWEILAPSSNEDIEDSYTDENVEEVFEEAEEADSYTSEEAEVYSGNSEDYYDKNSATEVKNYCNLSANAFFEFLTSNNFTLNGSGSVKFSRRYDYSREQYVEGDITISGSGTSLIGKYEVMNGSMIYISDLSVISGYFDASNNEGSSGAASVDCNGNLLGTLSEGYNSTDLRILLK